MFIIETVGQVLLFMLAINLWLMIGVTALFLMDADHLEGANCYDLIFAYLMWPVVALLSWLLERQDADKPDTTQP